MDDSIQDSLSLIPVTDTSRRGFFATQLCAGYALAVQPVSAQALSTPAEGLTAGEVQIPVQDGKIPAYRAMPAKGGKFPVVLVVQEIFGVHEHIKDICRRLAHRGYLAVAPELYVRQGSVAGLSDFPSILKVVAKVPDAQVMSDLDATLAWAGKNEGNTAKLAITGFCWGGRIVWLYAAHQPKLKAGVAWYGRLVGQASENTPKHPVEIAASLEAPVLGLYAGKDQGIPLDTVEKMRGALRDAKKNESEIIVYPDAQHGFHADYRPSYGKADAEDGWRRLLAHFKKNGVA